MPRTVRSVVCVFAASERRPADWRELYGLKKIAAAQLRIRRRGRGSGYASSFVRKSSPSLKLSLQVRISIPVALFESNLDVTLYILRLIFVWRLKRRVEALREDRGRGRRRDQRLLPTDRPPD